MVALILLLLVSILAMFLETLPIVLAAILSALIWNFLFIRPKATFSISTPQDALLFLMYFVIVLMNAVFTSRIRKMEYLAQQKKEREKTLQLYNTLLNSLSHELKTPISTIVGVVETLKINSTAVSEAHKLELFSELEIAANRLHRQVNNLLHMSRLESDFLKLQPNWYDINEIINSVIDNKRPYSQNHDLVFQAREDLPLFKVDGGLLEQILQNILQNALQYTPAGTRIEIRAKELQEGLEISISDHGPGFPPDKLDLVFDKFYRLPGTAAGGTGLGLSISRGFARAHQGDITLRNHPEGGAQFLIFIPAEKIMVTSENE